MAVQSITMVYENNPYSSDNYYDEPPQGVTYDFVRIYEIVSDDGSKQHFSLTIQLDSYGNAGGNYASVEQSIPKTFKEVKPQVETRTVFK